MNITLKTKILANSDRYLSSTIDDDLVVMDTKTGEYIGLNPVGGRIWQLAQGSQSIEEIVNSLLLEYNISKDSCEEQVISFVTKLIKDDIISIEQPKQD